MEHKLGKGFERLQFDSKKKQTKTPRKVVSSHIQVLKGKFKDSPALPDNKLGMYRICGKSTDPVADTPNSALLAR